MKIIASVNPNSFSENKVRKIILAGADIIRYNLGYQITDENIKNILEAQKIIDSLNSSTKILVDLPSNKTRLASFDEFKIEVKEGEELIFKSASNSISCKNFIPVVAEKLGGDVTVNQMITIANGEVSVEVIEIIDTGTIKAIALNKGTIYSMCSFNLMVNEDKYLKAIEEEIKKIKTIKIDYLALPYINKKTQEKIYKLITENEFKEKIMLKIGNKEAIDDIDTICKETIFDAILIDRGKLGVNTPFEQIGITQKLITQKVRENKKQVFISTQILESTIDNFIPHKSEILDLTNMVLDGINGIILCKETDVGNRPAYTISVAKKIINAVKQNRYKINK